MDLHAWVQERVAAVDEFLEAFLPPAGEGPGDLHAAMRHLVFPSGKRLRPAFALAAAEGIGADPARAVPAAAAVELLHNYSLIHDDLPCMDDDVERRGRPTVHVLFGEAVAVLAGDALLTAAFEALTRFDGPAEHQVAALREVARAAGAAGLVGGQVDDLAFAAIESPDADAVESIHRRKSAALIAASLSSGAALAGADPTLRESLHHFGLEIGVAFQITDDLLDADEDEGCSLLRVLSQDEARARSETLLARALGRIDPLGEPAEPLRELARFAVRREM